MGDNVMISCITHKHLIAEKTLLSNKVGVDLTTFNNMSVAHRKQPGNEKHEGRKEDIWFLAGLKGQLVRSYFVIKNQ